MGRAKNKIKFLESCLGVALAPQPSPTFKPLAIVEVEIRDALWQILDIP